MELEEAWKVLGVPPGTDEEHLKSAWRRLAAAWHPDRNPSKDAEARMKRLNQAMARIRHAREAGESLESKGGAGAGSAAPSAAKAKAKGQAPAGSGGASAPRATPAQGPHNPYEDLDIPEVGESIEPAIHWLDRDLAISLDEATLGCERQLSGQVQENCLACVGTGLQLEESACEACEGQGEVRKKSFLGFGGQTTKCEICHGKGRWFKVCTHCGGEGRNPAREWRLRTRIPPGVRDGDVLEIQPGGVGSTHLGVGVRLRIQWLAHPLFELGSDGVLRLEMPVDGLAWLTGAKVPLPVPGGWHELTLARNVVNLRLPGLGFPQARRGSRGDLEVHINPQFPDKFSDDQRALLNRLSEDLRTRAEGTDGHPLNSWQKAVARWQRQQRRQAEAKEA